ncbi:uncharacterized protein LOC112576357 [Pomacea canaliculata]|uniref:uncharacterized protein LOC112576357 n=1 Tax=Pomacea canaliculata TaxID=400727 RepID=UPI000D726006|nr:uncharacterized protein LOC112576357 [Pomacea canaliculata]
MELELPAVVEDVPTPCFLLDVDRVKANIARMQDTCQRLGVALRPHTKTHKTLEVADMVTNGQKRKIVCSTIAECNFYADAGYDDILLAFPVTANKIARYAQLANRLQEFHLLLSSVENLGCLRDAASRLDAGKIWSVFIEVDTGYGRSTWDPMGQRDVVRVGRCLWEEPCFRFRGVYTHCGESYEKMAPDARAADQATVTARLQDIASRLRTAGIDVPEVTTGSTPTCSMAGDVLRAVDQFHPGNFVFYDYENYLLGSCKLSDIACCVATRVVCQRPDLDTLVVDCGFTALGHDGMRQRPDDFCVIKDHPNLRVVGMSQELGKVKAKEGQLDFDRYTVGTLLFIYPYHACATAAMHQRYIAHSGDTVVGVWKPVKGW